MTIKPYRIITTEEHLVVNGNRRCAMVDHDEKTITVTTQSSDKARLESVAEATFRALIYQLRASGVNPIPVVGAVS